MHYSTRKPSWQHLKCLPWDPHGRLTHAPTRAKICRRAQTDFLSAATAKALTMVLAGFALTITILPKISLLPALVAGFKRVLIMHKPGIVHFPVFFTSRVAHSGEGVQDLGHLRLLQLSP